MKPRPFGRGFVVFMAGIDARSGVLDARGDSGKDR